MAQRVAGQTKTVELGGRTMPAMGQGTWQMGENPVLQAEEVRALRRGVELGMVLVDTAEMYGSGRSERLVGEAIAPMRDEVYLVSKVLPSNASHRGTVKACEASLKRLRTDRMELYLLHWPGREPLEETVAGFEELRAAGKVLRWGVSNLDVPEMEALMAVPDGTSCATNQVLYNPEHRGIEFDLLPWSVGRGMPVMAYSPVGQGGELLEAEVLRTIAGRHGMTTAQVALAWGLRQPGVCVIPKAGTVQHVEQNAAALRLELLPADLEAIDTAYPAPKQKVRLEML